MRNTIKIEKVSEKAFRDAYNGKHAFYQLLLKRMRLPFLESRRIQDVSTIHNCISNEAPRAIWNLINLLSSKYNLGPQEYVLSLLKVYLTNRFHVAVRLFSNRSQMMSKCGKNKKVAHEA